MSWGESVDGYRVGEEVVVVRVRADHYLQGAFLYLPAVGTLVVEAHIVHPEGERNLLGFVRRERHPVECFIIVDPQNMAFEVVENQQNLNLPQGAGIQAAKTIVDNQAAVLITGHCGPKAFKVLQGAGVKISSVQKEALPR